MIGYGSAVKDTLSNFTGIVVGVTSYLNGQMTFAVKSENEVRTLDSDRVVAL